MLDIFGQSGQTLAVWIQAVSNVFVLLLIYWQVGSLREQMSQSDEQNRAERAWQFMHFYQQEIGNVRMQRSSNGHESGRTSEDEWEEYFSVRLRSFSLLNQLVRFQQVDERLLFGFLSDEFLEFTARSVERLGRLHFAEKVSPRMLFLIATWGAEDKIYGPAEGGASMTMKVPQSADGGSDAGK